MSQIKPKEFWIIGQEVYTCEQLESPLAFHVPPIHVIEKSACDLPQKQLENVAKERDTLAVQNEINRLAAENGSRRIDELENALINNMASTIQNGLLKDRIKDLEAKVQRLEEANEIMRGSPGDYAELVVMYAAQNAEIAELKADVKFYREQREIAQNNLIELGSINNDEIVQLKAELETWKEFSNKHGWNAKNLADQCDELKATLNLKMEAHHITSRRWQEVSIERDELNAKLAVAIEVLGFYADEKNWNDVEPEYDENGRMTYNPGCSTANDSGHKALEALAKIRGEQC